MSKGINGILILVVLVTQLFAYGGAMHPCDRLCYDKSQSQICRYDFEVTLSQTMSPEHGCGDCPNNVTHCYSPLCIPGDGHQRPVYLVNGMFPGPSITVCEGDQVVINVTNRLISAESITLHWHGIYHIGTPFMDGTPMITQCPIPLGTTFQYRWTAEPAGTKFWHAHTSFHRADGLVGPLVVRPKISMAGGRNNEMSFSFADPDNKKSHPEEVRKDLKSNKILKKSAQAPAKLPLESLYDFGGDVTRDQDNVLIVQEWKKDPSPIHYVQDNEAAYSLLVNGRQGTSPASAPSYVPIRFDRPPAPNNRQYQPFLRIVSNGFLFCPIQTHLEGHRYGAMSSILKSPRLHAKDSCRRWNSPRISSHCRCDNNFPGERFDVEVLRGPNHDELAAYTRSAEGKAKGEPIKLIYAMRWWGLGDCHHDDFGANATSYVFAYEGKKVPKKSIIVNLLEKVRNGSKEFDHTKFLQSKAASPEFRIFNPVHELDFHSNPHHVPITDLKPSRSNEVAEKSIKGVDYKIYLFTDSFLLGDDIPMFNNISFQHPSAPLLSQYYDVPDKELCNYNTHPQCSHQFCACTHMYEIELGAVVEVVLVDEGLNGEYDIHSIHLHGYSFAVLAQEKLGQNVSIHEIKKMDQRGQLRRNLDHPVYKDSVAIPEGGYTIIRFVADNPGFWMLHCHLDFHFLKGMALIFKVGDVSQMPPIPAGFPKCGSWITQDLNMSPNRWKAFKP